MSRDASFWQVGLSDVALFFLLLRSVLFVVGYPLTCITGAYEPSEANATVFSDVALFFLLLRSVLFVVGYPLTCITGAYEPSEANATVCAKRERIALVSRFAQTNAASASLGS